PAYCEAVSRACDVRIAPNYPVIGADAFRTATGVHAAAVVKAFRMGDRALMDAVYAGVPASLVGREQEIEIGPLSGRSNVIFWLEKRSLPATDEIVDRVFAAAKASNRLLSHDQIPRIVDEARMAAPIVVLSGTKDETSSNRCAARQIMSFSHGVDAESRLMRRSRSPIMSTSTRAFRLASEPSCFATST